LCRLRDRRLVSVFYMWVFNFPHTICRRGCLFSSVCFWHLCQKSGGCSCVDLFLGALVHPIGLCVYFVPIPCCFCYYVSVVYFEVQYCETSSISLFAQITSAFQGLLCSHTTFRIDFSISVKNNTGILVGITLNL
jgi:hypothetical protein